jgi:O-antigen/teichoic acid export membrane protein
MGILKKLAGETASYGLSSMLGRVLNFIILTPYLTHLMSKSQFGIYSVYYSYAAYLSIILSFRVESALFRFSSDYDKSQVYTLLNRFVIKWALGIGLLSLPIWFLIAQNKSSSDKFLYWILIFLITFFDAIVAVPFGKLRLTQEAKKYARLKITNLVINLICVFVFVEWFCNDLHWLGGDIIVWLMLANLASSVFTCFQFWLGKNKKSLPSQNSSEFKHELNIGTVIRFTWPLVLVGLAGVVNQVLDRPMLLHLLPGDLNNREELTGVYSAAYRITLFLNLFIQAFHLAAEPFFFKNAQEKDGNKSSAQVALWFTAVCSFFLLGILLSLDFLQYFLGKEFRTGFEIIPFVLFGNLFLGWYYNLSSAFKISDRTFQGAVLAILSALLTILLNFLLIPKFGILGAAYTTFASYLFLAAGSYIAGQKVYHIPYPVGKILLIPLIAYVFHLVNTQFSVGVNPVILWGMRVLILGIFGVLCYLIIKFPNRHAS